MTWRWYIRCQKCGEGTRYYGGMTRPAATSADFTNRVMCDACGGIRFDDPRPARRVSASVWYDPRTWGKTRWEWRDDLAQPVPQEPEPANLRLLPAEASDAPR